MRILLMNLLVSIVFVVGVLGMADGNLARNKLDLGAVIIKLSAYEVELKP
jgi:hypothetical protein